MRVMVEYMRDIIPGTRTQAQTLVPHSNCLFEASINAHANTGTQAKNPGVWKGYDKYVRDALLHYYSSRKIHYLNF